MVGHRAIGDDDVVVDGQWHGWRQPVAGHPGSERQPTCGERLRGVSAGWHGFDQFVDVFVDDHDLVAVVAGDIREGRHSGCQRCEADGDPVPQLLFDACVDRLGVGVDPRDRRPGQDVVELLREHLLPELVEIGCRPARRRPQLGLAQQLLAPAVAELGADLARQRSPVRLEVQLAAPHRHRRAEMDLALDVAEELGWRTDRDAWCAVEVGEPPRALEHLARRSATAVAVSERHQRPVTPAVLGEVGDGVRAFGRCDLGVVGVDGWEVGEHACAVEPFPPERVVGEPVLLVPRQLLRHEAGHPAGCEHLWQTGRVAEHVGDPHLGAAPPEVPLEVPLAVHDLAHEALAGRQVHVGLDPHPAGRHPLSARDLRRDAGEELGLAVLDPRVLLRLRADEPVLGVLVHQPDGRGERPLALASRLADRPQPGGVDVRMPGRDDPVGARPGWCRQRRPDRWRAAATSGTRSRARRCRATTVAGGVVERECAHQSVEDAEVVHQRFGVGVDDDQIGALEPVQRLLACCRRRSEGGWPELRERRVRGRLHREHERSRLRVYGDVRALRMDPLDRLSGVVADETLALEPGGIAVEAEVDHGLDPAGGPVSAGSHRSGGTMSSPTAPPTSNRRRNR